VQSSKIRTIASIEIKFGLGLAKPRHEIKNKEGYYLTNKKQRILKAKTLRRMIKGLTLPQSVQLVKAMSSELKFLELLKGYGFLFDSTVTGHCLSDGAPEGYYLVFKNNVPAGKIPFNCCGIYVEEARA